MNTPALWIALLHLEGMFMMSLRSYMRTLSPHAILDSMILKGKGVKGSLTPFYDHYRYLSDGHRGFRSKEDVEELKDVKVNGTRARGVGGIVP